MGQKEYIKLFEQKKVRSVWDNEKEEWFFSIVDVCGVLTDQPDYDHARNYWKVLKHRLIKEGNETVTNCNQLKMMANDGKKRLTVNSMNSRLQGLKARHLTGQSVRAVI